MGFTGPNSTQGQGGTGGVEKSTDKVMAIVMGGIAVVDKIALNTILKCIQVSDAEAVGINAAYDANNDLLVFEHINEFFVDNPEGTLYVMLVSQGTTMSAMLETATNAPALLLDESTKREIKALAVVLNPAEEYTSVLEDGLDSQVIAAIPKAQALVDAMRIEGLDLDAILLEGREFNGTIAAAQDLRELAAPNVSVVIAADPRVSTANAAFEPYAAVGTALGSLCMRGVHENLGSLELLKPVAAKTGREAYPLTDPATGRWLSAALSSGTKVSALSVADQKALDDKGYIYAGRFPVDPNINSPIGGVFFSGDHTCVSIASDYNSISRNRVWNKAKRILNRALVTKIRSVVGLAVNGFVAPSTVAIWEARGFERVNQMYKDGEISNEPDFKIINKVFLPNEKVTTKLRIQPVGHAKSIDSEITLVSSL
jgi:hypothetical protein